MGEALPRDWLEQLPEQEGMALLIQSLTLVEGFAAYLVVCPTPAIADAVLRTLRQEVDRSRGERGAWAHLEPYGLRRAANDVPLEDWLVRQILLPLTDEQVRMGNGYRVAAVDASRASPQDDVAWEKLFYRMNRARDTIAQRLGCPLLILLPPRLEARFATAAPDFYSVRSAAFVIEAPRPSLDPGTLRFIAEAPALLPDDVMELVPQSDPTNALLGGSGVGVPLHACGQPFAELLKEVTARGDAGLLVAAVGEVVTSGDRATLDELARCLLGFALRCEAAGPAGLLLAAHQQATRVLTEITRRDPSAPLTVWYNLSAALHRVGDMLRDRRVYEHALALYQQALEVRRWIVARRPDDDRWQHALVRSLRRKGDLLLKMKRADESLGVFDESLRLSRVLASAAPNAGERWVDLTLDLLRAAVILLGRRDIARAQERADEACAAADRLVVLDPTRPRYRHVFALTRLLRGVMADVGRRAPEAGRWWREADFELRALAAQDPDNASVRAALEVCARRLRGGERAATGG